MRKFAHTTIGWAIFTISQKADRNIMPSPPRLGNSHPERSYGWSHGMMFVLAFVLACQAIWILAAEFYQSSSIGSSISSQSVALRTANRNDARLAALIGYIRGDLWAEELLTYSAAFRLNEIDNSTINNSSSIEQVRDIAERALSLAPHDSRTWLTLANIDSRYDWLSKKSSSELRMSYYTGANEIELIPLRLSLAVSSSLISDADFQILVRHDIRTALTRKPELKNAILVAYRNALPEGQHFIEQTLKDMDATLLSTLRSK